MYSETRDKQINYYLKLSGAIFLMVVALFMIIVSGSISSYLGSVSQDKTITVSGYAEMNATPDIRTVYISILGKGTTEKLAQEDASVKSKKVSEVLKSQKISGADIKSQSLSTYPEYKNKTECPPEPVYMKVIDTPVPNTQPYRPCSENSVIFGYNTTQSIEVTLRGTMMDKAAELVSSLTDKGITIQTGEATIENPEKAKTELRAKAILDARANAEKLAEALGVDLGKVESFNENSGGDYYPMMAKSSAMDESSGAVTSPVISNGTQKLTSTVSVSFEIR